ncbi:MAG TPA: hypothetical protein VFG10_19035 [Saprospiraceae bacterium]|nr:hypothetical protein [Saprospiraceae bacterium]
MSLLYLIERSQYPFDGILDDELLHGGEDRSGGEDQYRTDEGG